MGSAMAKGNVGRDETLMGQVLRKVPVRGLRPERNKVSILLRMLPSVSTRKEP